MYLHLNDSLVHLTVIFPDLNIKDEQSFHELYIHLKAPIYAYSLSLLKNREDSLDNVQDVFITLYREIDSYQPNQKPMNWIFTIKEMKKISHSLSKKINCFLKLSWNN